MEKKKDATVDLDTVADDSPMLNNQEKLSTFDLNSKGN